MRPRVALAALALAAVCALLARGVRLDGDVSRLVPEDSPELRQAVALLRRVAVVDVEGGAADARRFIERLPPAYEVRAAPDEAELLDLVDTLRKKTPLLLDDPAELDLGNVPERLQTLARRLQEPDGAHLARRAARDPLGITDLALKPLEALTAGLSDARFDEAGVKSADGRHRLVLVDPGFPAADTERTEEFLATLRRAGEGLTVRHLGAHRATHDNARRIESDAVRSGIVGSILILALTLLVFRRLAPVLLAITPALFGVAIALGVLALFRDSVAAAVVGFSAALLGITIDYAIHIFYGTRVPVRAILIGATTTAAAFLCLNASSLPGLREAGTLGAIGVLAAALFALAALTKRGERRPLDLGRITAVLQSRTALRIAILPLLFLLVGLPRLRAEGDVLKMSRLSAEAERDEREIEEIWGDAFRASMVLVEGEDLEQALQRNDAVAARLDSRPHASIAGLLPSLRTQEERWRRWQAFWSAERIAGLREAVAGTAEAAGFRADAFEPFFAWLETRPEPLRADDLPAALLRDRVQRTAQGWWIATPVFDPGLEELDGALVVNRAAMVRRIAGTVATELRTLGLLAFVVVGVVVGLWFGRLRPVVVVLASLALSCVATIGLLGWLGVGITLANTAFVVFLFGLAVDYAIFLVEARLSKARTGVDRVAESDGAVLLCGFTTCAGFLALATASHPVLQSIGITAVAGIAVAAVLMQMLVPRLWREAPEPRTVAALFRDQGPILSRYAAGKARRDPVMSLAASLGPRRDILVAGCGYGVLAARILLERPAQHLRGIDRDPRKIEVARRTLRGFENATFACGDLRTTDLGQPDLITLLDVLHYWSGERQAEILERVVAALEPGGELLFRDGCLGSPGHAGVRRREAFALRIGFTQAADGLHFRTETGWRNLLHGCGLDVDAEPSAPDSGNLILRCRKPKP
jgi:predicted exporter